MRGNSLFHSCRPILDIFRVTVLKLRYITDANGSRERTFMSYADHNISNLRLKVCIKPLPTFVVSVGKFPANYFGFSGVVRFKGITFILYLNYTWHLIWTWNVKNFIRSFYCIYLYSISKIVGVIKEIKSRDIQRLPRIYKVCSQQVDRKQCKVWGITL